MVNFLPVLKSSYLVWVEVSIAPANVEVRAGAGYFREAVSIQHQPNELRVSLLHTSPYTLTQRDYYYYYIACLKQTKIQETISIDYL